MYLYAGLSSLWLWIFLWKTQEITKMQKNTRNPNSLCITVVSIISWTWLAQKYCRKCFFLWYFCFLSQKIGSITQQHVKMREKSILLVGWVMGTLDFRFLCLFPSLQWRPQGCYGSTHQLWAPRNAWSSLGRVGCGQAQSCCEGTGITFLSSLLYACREADQSEVLLCSFR